MNVSVFNGLVIAGGSIPSRSISKVSPLRATSSRVGVDPLRSTAVRIGPSGFRSTSARLGVDPQRSTAVKIRLP